jgi:hypothetical protein
MVVTDEQLEEIREAIEAVDFGSVTVRVNADREKLELVTEKRQRLTEDTQRRQRSVLSTAAISSRAGHG